MGNTSRHLSTFNPTQILQIVNWGREKLNLSSKTLEDKDTKIVLQEMPSGRKYLVEVDVNGKIYNPNR